MHSLRISSVLPQAVLPLLLAALIVTLASCSNEPSSSDKPSLEEAMVPAAKTGTPSGMVFISGGRFLMGANDGMPQETPIHEVTVDPFYMDTHEVTNNRFAEFVAATGYVTEAEEWGWSLGFLPDSETPDRVPGAEWWVKVDAADWRRPLGPGSSIEGKGDDPVVQVSWNDAIAYCRWAGKRLPTETEWEFAARGGLSQKNYPWGDAFEPNGKSMANTWNGIFPRSDSGKDGYSSISPVGSYPPNAYGLYDTGGNVWEWCLDWFDGSYYARSPSDNPQGPERGIEKVLRGGSWLCAPNYCHGYRASHRNHSGIDTGLNHVGFRCVKSIEEAE